MAHNQLRIAYCTNVRLPNERAHGHQVASVCRALNRLGHTVTIFCPERRNVTGSDVWTYHDLPRSVQLAMIGAFDPIACPLLPGVLGLWTMNAMLRRGLSHRLRSASYDLIYTRSPALLPGLLRCGMPVILELHSLPRFGRTGFVRHCNACTRIACLTSPMAAELVSLGVRSELVMVEGDAVDLSRFEAMPSCAEAKAQFRLPTSRAIVGYVGKLRTLNMEKGVHDLLEVIVRDRRLFAFVVGGPAHDVAMYRARSKALGLTHEDVHFAGEIPSVSVPSALAACDVVVMPFPDLPHYRTNMSPLKMFEYMAAKRPIVTSDLPTIRDVLSEETAFFCRPGDANSLQTAIDRCIRSPEEAQRKAHAARVRVEEHTWEKRMARILLHCH